MKHKLPKHVRRKPAKGKDYYYFETGALSSSGKPILKRLPDVRDPTFGRALQAANAARSRRTKVQTFLTVAALVDLYEKGPDFRAKAPATQRVYRIYLEHIKALMGEAPADDVKPRDSRMMMDRMGERPGAANMAVRTLGALYSWGRAREHVTTDPFKGVKLLAQGEHEPWPEWLVERALVAEDRRVRLVTGLLYYTAQRIGDVMKLRWTDVRDGAFHVRQQKTGKDLQIPVHEALAAILAETPRTGFTIVAQPDGRPYAAMTMRKVLQAFAEQHGAKVVPHGLRKNAVNALLEAECSVAETAAISGQTLQLVEHYAKRRNQQRLGAAAILKWEKRK